MGLSPVQRNCWTVSVPLVHTDAGGYDIMVASSVKLCPKHANTIPIVIHHRTHDILTDTEGETESSLVFNLSWFIRTHIPPVF